MIEQLIQQAQPYWQQYIEHEFVQQVRYQKLVFSII